MTCTVFHRPLATLHHALQFTLSPLGISQYQMTIILIHQTESDGEVMVTQKLLAANISPTDCSDSDLIKGVNMSPK